MSEDPKQFFRQEALEHFARKGNDDEPLRLITTKPWCLYLAGALLLIVALLLDMEMGSNSLIRMFAS